MSALVKLSPVQRNALTDACRLGRLSAFYSSYSARGRIYSSTTINVLVRKGLMAKDGACGAEPTEAGRALAAVVAAV